MPSKIDDYVHRIGRTGRVGNNGRATSFFDPEKDRAIAADLVKILEGSGQTVPDFLRTCGAGGDGGYSNQNFGGVDVRGRVSKLEKLLLFCTSSLLNFSFFLYREITSAMPPMSRKKSNGIEMYGHRFQIIKCNAVIDVIS